VATKNRKDSYTIPCSSAFCAAINALADRRRVNVADLARSVLLVAPAEVIRSATDPGGPPPGDREEAVIKSGPSKGRPWRRKPRLQVRLAPGYDPSFVRRALNLALSLDQGDISFRLENGAPGEGAAEAVPQVHLTEELERLRTIVSALSFEPLAGGVKSRAEALHVLGFPPSDKPGMKTLQARFRMLATIHHPDSGFGNHRRMSQLNEAMDLLRG
jgi:hypothetical protein